MFLCELYLRILIIDHDGLDLFPLQSPCRSVFHSKDLAMDQLGTKWSFEALSGSFDRNIVDHEHLRT